MHSKLPRHIEILRSELRSRQDRNNSYSLRSFAQALRVSPAWLSSVLNGERAVTVKMAEKVFPQICTTQGLVQVAIQSVAKSQIKRSSKKAEKKAKIIVSENILTLSNDTYRVIHSWYHSAILELVSIKGFKSDTKWISEQLEISKLQAEEALLDLVDQGLLQWNQGKILRSDLHVSSKEKNHTSAALKKIQREFREKSIDAIENQPIEKRSHTHVTMAIDPDLLPEAKKRIYKFQKELCKFLESKSKKQVYVMEIGLFNLQNKTGETK